MPMISKVDAIKTLVDHDAGLQILHVDGVGGLVCTIGVEVSEAEETAIAYHLRQLNGPELADNWLNDASSCPRCGHPSSTFTEDGYWMCDECSCSW